MAFVGAEKRIAWKSVYLGDYAYAVFDYSANNEIRVIPRAKGVKVRDTETLGGGYFSITVVALIAKDNRTSIESTIAALDSSLDLTASGDLVISDANGSVTLSDCYLESFNQSQEDARVNTITFKFIKSL